jgi:hypothetical protein
LYLPNEQRNNFFYKKIHCLFFAGAFIKPPAAVYKHAAADFAIAYVPDFFMKLDGVIEIIKKTKKKK